MFDPHVAAISVAVNNNSNYCDFHRQVNTDTERDRDRDRGVRQEQGHRQGQGLADMTPFFAAFVLSSKFVSF